MTLRVLASRFVVVASVLAIPATASATLISATGGGMVTAGIFQPTGNVNWQCCGSIPGTIMTNNINPGSVVGSTGTLTLDFDLNADFSNFHNRYVIRVGNNSGSTQYGIKLTVDPGLTSDVFFTGSPGAFESSYNTITGLVSTVNDISGSTTATQILWQFLSPLAPGAETALTFEINFVASDPSHSPVTITETLLPPVDVPEPSSLALLLGGLVAVGVARRRGGRGDGGLPAAA